MASTRNKNCPGDYKLEQHVNTYIDSHSVNKIATVAYQNYLPGDGLLPAKTPRKVICENYTDVESQLFGIGSTNLVNPQAPVTPSFQPIQTLNVIDRIPIMVPQPLVVENGQRPMYLN
jgi:hypothetical protein